MELSAIQLDTKGAAFPFHSSILMLSVSVCTLCYSHVVLLRNLEIERGGKEWVKTERGRRQLPFCSPCTMRAGSGTPKLSFLPIRDAVMVKGQLQQAGSIENLYFPGDALE